MTPDKIIKIVVVYAARLELKGIRKKRMDTSRAFASLSTLEHLEHAHYTCDNVLEYAQKRTKTWADGRKVGSHLTVIQMCLSEAGWYTLDELMTHNASD